jgi:hypothetical protein
MAQVLSNDIHGYGPGASCLVRHLSLASDTVMAAEGRRPEIAMSAIHPKADIAKHYWDVRFVPKADISLKFAGVP